MCFFLGVLSSRARSRCYFLKHCVSFLLPPCFSWKKRSQAEHAAAAAIVGATIELQPHCTAFKLSFPSFPLSCLLLRLAPLKPCRLLRKSTSATIALRTSPNVPSGLGRSSMCSVPFNAGFVFYFFGVLFSRSHGIRRLQLRYSWHW